MEYLNGELLFLRERIEKIKVALFKAESESDLQLPNNVISTLKVDEAGCIWFFTSCAGPYVPQVDKELHASLTYYQKGNGYLQISGTAVIEDTNQNFLQADHTEKNKMDYVLLKVKILKAEYFETKSAEKISLTNKLKSRISHLLRRGAGRV